MLHFGEGKVEKIKEPDCVPDKLFNILTVVTGRPKRLLVIVNPFGGGGVGRKVYKNAVEPLLNASGVSYTMRGADSMNLILAYQRGCVCRICS